MRVFFAECEETDMRCPWILCVLCVLMTKYAAVQTGLCNGDINTSSSTIATLSLECNTSHMLSTVSIENEENSFFYAYFVGIKCFDANGSKTETFNLEDGVHLGGNVSYVNISMRDSGLDCMLYGCYRDFNHAGTLYALAPAHCIIDDDECFINAHMCSEPAVCTNTIGGYSCSCRRGYEGDGFNCIDIDECDKRRHNCSDDGAKCHNTPGSYSCSCLEGYAGDGFNCTDMDECVLRIDECHDKYGICNNTDGSYYCSCKTGFTGDGVICDNVDECALNEDTCDENAECNDSIGSYNCSCKEGFSGDGFTCFDVDECVLRMHECHSEFGICNNTDGSYYCSCKTGFTGDGVICDNVDECALNEDKCDENAECNDTIGNYNCSCKEEFFGDGFTCFDAASVDIEKALVVVVSLSFMILLLCAILALIMVIVFCMGNMKKKSSELYDFKPELGEQKLDKDYNPVDPAPELLLYASLQSVIEPLCSLQSGVTTVCKTESNVWRSVGNTIGDENKQDESTCTLQSHSYDISKSAYNCACNSKIDSSNYDSMDINATQHVFSSNMKDESGFISDTSTSVYLSCYNFSDNHS